MKNLFLLSTLLISAFLNGTAYAQCSAPLTISPTANPAEVEFEYDLGGVTNPTDFVGIIYIFNTTTQTDYGFVYVTQNSNPLTYQFPANGTYDLASVTQDSMSTCTDSVMYNHTVTTVNTSGCTAAFTIVNDSVVTTQYYGFNNSTGTNLSYLWNFGDGGTSTDQYPTHVFASVGTFNVCLTIDDGFACTDTICQTITVFTKASQTTLNIYDPALAGFEQQVSVDEITVYPNPTNGNFSISFQSQDAPNSTISIMDLNGRIVASTIVESTSGYNQVDFDLEGIAPGVYFWNMNDVANGKVLIK